MTFATKKHLGQHFLVDNMVIADIVAECAIAERDIVIEIGAGQGALTHALPPCAQLHLLELDHRCIDDLRARFPAATLWHADAVRFDYHALLTSIDTDATIHIIGNLPYNASSQIIMRTLRDIHTLAQSKNLTLFFMVQKEMAERVCAQAGSKHYGRLSVMAQTQARTSASRSILPESFSPPPKVDSQMIRLVPRTTTPECSSEYDQFARFVQTIFNHKRKTLANNLKTLCSKDALATVTFDFSRRAETCTNEEVVMLFRILVQATN